MPGSELNPINPMSRGVIPVALLGSDTFDVLDVDVTSLTFGPGGAPSVLPLTNPWVFHFFCHFDVNHDGHKDLFALYRTQETGIAFGDDEALVWMVRRWTGYPSRAALALQRRRDPQEPWNLAQSGASERVLGQAPSWAAAAVDSNHRRRDSLTGYIALVVLSATLVCQSAAAEPLCAGREPLPEGADDLRVNEDDFTAERALKSLEFLRTDFAKRIWGTEPVTDFSAWSGHYIGYANSLKSIEGALLKQQVLLRLAQRDALRATAPGSAEKRAADESLKEATRRFCRLIESETYAD